MRLQRIVVRVVRSILPIDLGSVKVTLFSVKNFVPIDFQTLGGERWYVDKIELTYNSSDRHFEHIEQPSEFVNQRCLIDEFDEVECNRWFSVSPRRQDRETEHRTETQLYAVPDAGRKVVQLPGRGQHYSDRRQESRHGSAQVNLIFLMKKIQIRVL